MNALRHGLTAATLVLTTEEKGKFDELLGAYIDEYQPATQTESDLVQEITVSKWLQRRCWALQTALLDVTMDRMEDDIDAEFAVGAMETFDHVGPSDAEDLVASLELGPAEIVGGQFLLL